MRLIHLGPPGAGKGTHAKILSEKHQVPHLAAGDILRRNIREQTPLGLKAKDVIERGELVSDSLVNQMMTGEIRKSGVHKGFILDGYPRTRKQAEVLDSFLEKQKAKLDAVLNFVTTEDVIVDRLSGRRVCTQCGKNYHIRNIPPKKEGICDQCGIALVQRKDDQPETISHRLKVYRKETEPLIGYYAKKRILWEVSGDHDVPELQQEIHELFERLKLNA
ncbi:MAG: adenylate kinase [Candidatus Omnitrophica bacterium]|nr:adenylate kinase [Candidatus Omnitrophota bacterium]